MIGHQFAFHDREEAGRALATQLLHLSGTDPLVLALPRGGVPVAFQIAKQLDAELDLLMVRKLGAPNYPEIGLGAVVDGANPQIVLNETVVRQLNPGDDYIHAETRRQLNEIDRQRRRYRPGRGAVEMKGRTVIIVDDGIATGGTIRAALRGVRMNHPRRIVLAVPVAPRESVELLYPECDELVCLSTPEPFYAVGAHYADFSQTSDDQVIHLLQEAQTFGTRKLTASE